MKFVPRVITDGRAVALGGYIHRVNENVIRRNLSVPSASASFGGNVRLETRSVRLLAR